MARYPQHLDGPIIDWEHWLNSAVGQYFVEWEQAQFDQMVVDVFGYRALQLGLANFDGLRQNRIASQSLVVDQINIAATHQRISHLARFDMLPFASESIDLVLLPHTLECVDSPRTVLREVKRILRPEGRVVLSGFNPVSLWGLRHTMALLLDKQWLPQGVQLHQYARVKAWLRILGFEIDEGGFGCYRLPVNKDSWLRYCAFMDKAGDRWWPILGAGYILSAVKREMGMRLVGPAWKHSSIHQPNGAPVVQPAPCGGAKRLSLCNDK